MADNPTSTDPAVREQERRMAASGQRWSAAYENMPTWLQGASADTQKWSQDYYNQENPEDLVGKYREEAAQKGIRADEGDANIFRSIAENQGRFVFPDAQPPQQQSTAATQPTSSWMHQSGGNTTTNDALQQALNAQTAILQQMQARATQADTDNEARRSSLFNMLMARAQQSKQIDPNDPIIRQQTDAFSAEQERARRNYLADLAEREGPLTNLRGEQRMSQERMGQNVGGFRAELLGRELSARREEIAQALSSMGGMLNADQQLALQRELSMLDNAIRQQGLGLNERQLDLERLLGMRGLDDQNDRFIADLGFRAADRASYWDSLRRGLL